MGEGGRGPGTVENRVLGGWFLFSSPLCLEWGCCVRLFALCLAWTRGLQGSLQVDVRGALTRVAVASRSGHAASTSLSLTCSSASRLSVRLSIHEVISRTFGGDSVAGGAAPSARNEHHPTRLPRHATRNSRTERLNETPIPEHPLRGTRVVGGRSSCVAGHSTCGTRPGHHAQHGRRRAKTTETIHEPR